MAVALVVTGIAGSLSAYADDDERTGPGPRMTRSTPDRTRTLPTTSSPTSEPAGSGDREAAAVAGELGPIVGLATGTGGTLEIDPTCFEASWSDVPPDALEAFDGMTADPVGWSTGVDPDAAELVFSAYLECVDPAALRALVALSPVRLPIDSTKCVADGWEGTLTAQAVASSAAHGDRLDDLAPAVVDLLTSAVLDCVADRRWWIEDVAYELEGTNDMTFTEAGCVAAAYVDLLGVEEVVRRRILTVPLLAIPDDIGTQLELPQRCGVPTITSGPRLDAPVGACLAGFGRGTSNTWVTDCDRSHNAEVIGVHDLTDAYPQWPGMRALVTDEPPRCGQDLQALTGDTSDYGAGWDLPNRARWEAEDRALMCVLLKGDFEAWTGASGLVPPVPPPTTTEAPRSTAAPSTTIAVPPTGEALVDYTALAVGQCVFEAPTEPGKTEAEPTLLVVACDAPHQWEVFDAFDIKGDPAAPFPGQEAVFTLAHEGCYAAFAGYVGAPYDSSRLYYSSLAPDSDSWGAGFRAVRCVLHGGDGEELFTSSLADSGE